MSYVDAGYVEPTKLVADYVQPGYAYEGFVSSGYLQRSYAGQTGSGARFLLGAQSINFGQGPLRPATDLELLQADFASAGGHSFALAQIAEEQILLLRWPRLYGYYRTRLLDWFFNVAQGMANSFSYRAPDGTSYTVRLASPELPEIREVADQRYRVEIPLLVIS